MFRNIKAYQLSLMAAVSFLLAALCFFLVFLINDEPIKKYVFLCFFIADMAVAIYYGHKFINKEQNH